MKLSPDFELIDVADENLAVPVGEAAARTHGVIALTDASAFLLRQMKEAPRTEAELVRLLTEVYDVTAEDAARDVAAAVVKYRSLGLIED